MATVQYKDHTITTSSHRHLNTSEFIPAAYVVDDNGLEYVCSRERCGTITEAEQVALQEAKVWVDRRLESREPATSASKGLAGV
jgi:hypothetical protein